MNKHIIYATPDGGVAVVVPAPNCGLTIEQIMAKDCPQGVSPEIVPVETIPSDRTFRNAWAKGLGRVDVNMEKARGIWMDKIREARNAELAKLDLAYIQADEGGSAQEKLAIAKQKTALRNIPETFDLSSAQTPEQLKTLWPEGLPK
jgi:hypothetical protein